MDIEDFNVKAWYDSRIGNHDFGLAPAKNLPHSFQWPTPIPRNGSIASSCLEDADYCNQEFCCLVDENRDNIAGYDTVSALEQAGKLACLKVVSSFRAKQIKHTLSFSSA